MKIFVATITLPIFLSLAAAPAAAQMTRNQKLLKIEHEIAWYESRESKGGWFIVGGLASVALGQLALTGDDPNWVSYGLLNGAGVIAMSWGAVMRWDAQQYLLHLRVKRYDFVMNPLYLPGQGNAIGLTMAARF